MEFDEKRLRRWTDPLEGFIDAGPLQDCFAELDRLRKIEQRAETMAATYRQRAGAHPDARIAAAHRVAARHILGIDQ